jgi:hypothetical protein
MPIIETNLQPTLESKAIKTEALEIFDSIKNGSIFLSESHIGESLSDSVTCTTEQSIKEQMEFITDCYIPRLRGLIDDGTINLHADLRVNSIDELEEKIESIFNIALRSVSVEAKTSNEGIDHIEGIIFEYERQIGIAAPEKKQSLYRQCLRDLAYFGQIEDINLKDMAMFKDAITKIYEMHDENSETYRNIMEARKQAKLYETGLMVEFTNLQKKIKINSVFEGLFDSFDIDLKYRNSLLTLSKDAIAQKLKVQIAELRELKEILTKQYKESVENIDQRFLDNLDPELTSTIERISKAELN